MKNGSPNGSPGAREAESPSAGFPRALTQPMSSFPVNSGTAAADESLTQLQCCQSVGTPVDSTFAVDSTMEGPMHGTIPTGSDFLKASQAFATGQQNGGSGGSRNRRPAPLKAALMHGNGTDHRFSTASNRKRALSAPDVRSPSRGLEPPVDEAENEFARTPPRYPSPAHESEERQGLLSVGTGLFRRPLGRMGSRRQSYVSDGQGWERDFYEEAKEDKFFVFKGTMESVKTAHRFTDIEKQRMLGYDALEFWTPSSQMMKEKAASQLSGNLRRSSHRWIIFGTVGIAVGIVAFMLLNTLNALHEWRTTLLEDSLKPLSGTSRWYGFLPWLGTGFGFVLVSSILCYFWPPAAGSGVPDVMAYLNGVMFRRVFNVKTLLMKVVSCALAVGGGMPVGPEGPMIHIGALIGAGISAGRSRTLQVQKDGCWRGMAGSTPQQHRDFITAGAAAGVACAFSAPVGGLLFVIEEITSFYSTKAMWMAFFSCLVAIVTFNSLSTNIESWQVRESAGGKCTAWARWESSNTVLFKANVLKDVNMWCVVPVLVTGLVCGILASIFTFINLKIVRWRQHTVNKTYFRRILEPSLLFLIYGSFCILLVMSTDCYTKPELLPGSNFSLNFGNKVGTLKWFDAVCDEPEKEYHPLGTLVFSSADDGVRFLFRRDPSVEWGKQSEHLGMRQESLIGTRIFGYTTLLTWLALYGSFACWAAGTYVASGIVIPMLTIGSIIGRFVGLACVDVMEHLLQNTCGGVDEWVDPGLFALVGAAAFFGGVSRLTFSLCVILLELSGDLESLMPVMLGVMVAKTVADNFTHPLYHALLEIRCVPFLDFNCNLPYLDVFSAAHLMSKVTRVTMFRIHHDPIEHIIKALKKTNHHGFPVVGTKIRPGRFKGTVTRSQLRTLLWWVHEKRQELRNSPELREQREQMAQQDFEILVATKALEEAALLSQSEYEQQRDKMHWREYDQETFNEVPPWPDWDPIMKMPLDLLRITNTSAFSVPKNFCVSATYTLFRSMGLRHLVVVNAANQVVGIITRKDLLSQNIEDHTISRTHVTATRELLLSDFGAWCTESHGIDDPASSGDGVLGLGKGRKALVVQQKRSFPEIRSILTQNDVGLSEAEMDRIADEWSNVVPHMRLATIRGEAVGSEAEVKRALKRQAKSGLSTFDVEFLPPGLQPPSLERTKDLIGKTVEEQRRRSVYPGVHRARAPSGPPRPSPPPSGLASAPNAHSVCPDSESDSESEDSSESSGSFGEPRPDATPYEVPSLPPYDIESIPVASRRTSSAIHQSQSFRQATMTHKAMSGILRTPGPGLVTPRDDIVTVAGLVNQTPESGLLRPAPTALPVPISRRDRMSSGADMLSVSAKARGVRFEQFSEGAGSSSPSPENPN
eukprot:Hpha_TRINITY_DN30372_c0_g1::TRINITY_DN30372_c0_g1_i1::g.147005::m.147005